MDRAPDVTPELPTRTWRAILALLGRLPQGAASRAMGRLADTPLPRPLRRPVLTLFARAFGIDAAEAERPITEYGSINDFFVRRLRPGARTWSGDAATLASPVDGIIGRAGPIERGTLIQAKGRHYRVGDLLASDEDGARYDGGAFITIYLSPRHYHRIHAPCGGAIVGARHVPGGLLPVNGPAVAHVDRLFARNERLVCEIEGPLGRVAVVAVGAYNVGRISAAFDAGWGDATAGGSVTNRRGAVVETRRYDPPRTVRPGEEIMAFHLGSTVVLLVEPGRIAPRTALGPGREIRLGSVIAAAV